MSFYVVYIDPIYREFLSFTDPKGFAKYFTEALSEAFGVVQLRLATLAIDFAKHAIRMYRKRIAILVDDVFQAIRLDKVATYVKSLLNLIEYIRSLELNYTIIDMVSFIHVGEHFE